MASRASTAPAAGQKVGGKARKSKRKAPLSASEKAANKLKADHRAAIRAFFTRAGFHRVTGVSDREFTYENQKSDIDDIFVYENVIILAEYTCAQSSGVGEHLKNKKHIYDKILADPEAFLTFLAENFNLAQTKLRQITMSSSGS